MCIRLHTQVNKATQGCTEVLHGKVLAGGSSYAG